MRWTTYLLAACSATAAEPAADGPDIGGLFAAVHRSVVADQDARAAAAPVLHGRWLTVRATAYSPHDAVDGAYHASKGERWRWITADGRTDVRDTPYGIAVPRLAGGRPAWPYGTRVLIPAGQGYLDQSGGPADRIFTVDDCGGGIRGRTESTGILHIDLRFRRENSARAFGGDLGWRELRVFVIDDLGETLADNR